MNRWKKAGIITLSAWIAVSSVPVVQSVAEAEPDDVLYEDFTDGSLDDSKWLVAKKNWGGKVTENGITMDYNGGVIPQNVSIAEGKLILTGHGNQYEGDAVTGINRDGSARPDGKRTGAAIATKEYYASGSYEIMAKVAPELGACSALWTFEYEEDWDTGAITNHEIDIEMPGRPGSAAKDQSFQYALCNTWIGENDGEYKTGYTDLGVNQADGAFHKYRFDWHTGDAARGEEARVEFYFDDVLVYTSYDYIPTNAGRLWIGLWFPRNWAGTPDFDTTTFEIDSVKITPFHESGDTPQHETYPEDGWGDLADIQTSQPLEPSEPSEPVPQVLPGDVNGDGIFDVQDAVSLQHWLVADGITLQQADQGDLNQDGILNVYDLCQMKRLLQRSTPDLIPDSDTHKVYVTNAEELKTALAVAQPNDEILLAPGIYVYDGKISQWHTFTGEADGTEAQPIILRSEDPQNPAVLEGTDVEKYYGLTITGDWWILQDLVIKNSSKGIIVDNANHTRITGCEVYQIGAEGIHFRDGSSYCLAENCFVHDTGLISPGYGEAIYVGSAKNTTDYAHECDYNTIRNCRLGPNVAAEHVDIKEYTTGTLVEGCTFDGTGMSGENSADSFVDMKGNDCVVRENTAYRNGCEKINRVFESNKLVDGWGQNAFVYNNQAYMDTSKNSKDGKMYFLNCWNCSVTAWNNWIAYESGELMSVDDPTDKWSYYNCNFITYGDDSYTPER